MGIHDRRYDDDFGERRRVINLSNFFDWSLPFFTVPARMPAIGGIRVRIHLIYILVVGGQLLDLLGKDSLGLRYVGAMIADLFVLVLLHEFGHCIACRRVGGEADEVLMWPLGGLAHCRPPRNWKAALVTTAGGPAVNVFLVPVLGLALLLMGAHWGDLIFNPFRPGRVLGEVFFSDSAPRVWVWCAYYMNLVLLLFNLLLPMYPMDGARIVQELLWGRIGEKRSLRIAAAVGLVTAILLAVYGLVTWNLRMVGLAVFGGSICYSERVRARSMDDQPDWMYDTDKGFAAFEGGSARAASQRSRRRAQKAEAKQREKQEKSQATVDAILDKIRDQGIASLTHKERATLDAASRQMRPDRRPRSGR